MDEEEPKGQEAVLRELGKVVVLLDEIKATQLRQERLLAEIAAKRSRVVLKCPTCGGRGRVDWQDRYWPVGSSVRCRECHGTGQVIR